MEILTLKSRHRPTEADIPASGKKRFRMVVEYDGTRYCGFQRQKNGLAVQQVLEEALSDLTGEDTPVVGSSRTDAGVHARGLCAHFDSATSIPPEKLSFALNTRLPEDVRIRESALAAPGFHARYSACGKIYSYHISNARHTHPIGRLYTAAYPLPLDVERMQRELEQLIGTHDFAPFAASGSVVHSTVRTLYRVRAKRQGDEITLLLLGDGFLYNMVRIIAGTVMEVGSGKRPEGAIRKAIQSGNRLDLGFTAPACGLILETVLYESQEEKALAYFAT